MIELSKAEVKQQVDVLQPIRLKHHQVLGRTGIAARLFDGLTATGLSNQGPLTGKSFLYVFREDFGTLSPAQTRPLERSDPATIVELEDLFMGHGEGIEMLMLGRMQTESHGSSYRAHFAAARVAIAGATIEPMLHPLTGLTYEDAQQIAELVDEIGLLKITENLTCLGENLVNDSITVKGPIPLP